MIDYPLKIFGLDLGQFACCLIVAVVGVVFDAILLGFFGALVCWVLFFQATKGKKENYIIHRLYAAGLLRYRGILPPPKRQSRYAR
jgi:type IV conjugative transfer system protein TraL